MDNKLAFGYKHEATIQTTDPNQRKKINAKCRIWTGYYWTIDRFILQCLPEDYKQKRYSENAKKQKSRPKIQQNLAVLTPLNQEDEEEKQEQKEVVVIGTEGMTYTQREEVLNSPNQ